MPGSERTSQGIPRQFAVVIIAVALGVLLQLRFQSRRSRDGTGESTGIDDLLRPITQREYAVCSAQSATGHGWLGRSLPSWLSQRRRAAIQTLQGDNGSSPVECFVVSHGHIVATGSEKDVVKPWCEEKQRRVEQQCHVRYLPPGYTLLPSFSDAHGHLLAFGESLESVDLVGTASLSEAIQRIENFVLDRPWLLNDKHKWVIGNAWDQTRWNDTEGDVFPTSRDLDASAVLRGRPISLKRIDFHALWISSEGMRLIETNGKLPDSGGPSIPGGLVVRNPSGQPTGILIDNAMQLALDVIPPMTDEDRTRYLLNAEEALFSMGITSVGDAAAPIEDIAFYKAQSGTGRLRLRVYAFLACPHDEPYCADLASTKLNVDLPLVPAETKEDRLTARTVKLFVDGALGSWGSAMWEPYNDRPSDSGLLLIEPDKLNSLVRHWSERGWQVAIHAIGDRANTLVLDAFNASINADKRQSPRVDLRHRVEHAQLVRPADQSRFFELGILASMQPTHCTSDLHYVPARIGHDRAASEAYPWRSLADSGAKLVFGSDFPVESPSVIEGLWSAVTRIGTVDLDRATSNDDDGGGDSSATVVKPWYGQQSLTVSQAVRAFTTHVAYAQHEEEVAGTIAAGKRADFVVLRGDLFTDITVKAAQGYAARGTWKARGPSIVATAMDGRWVWPPESRSE